MANRVQVEIFITPHCNKCGRSVALLESLHKESPEIFSWRVVDVLAELDYAVETGVRATPGIAINGRLIFTAQPAKERLREAIQQAGNN